MSPEQEQTLIRLYNAQSLETDMLPYTDEFEAISRELPTLHRREVWRHMVRLRKRGRVLDRKHPRKKVRRGAAQETL